MLTFEKIRDIERAERESKKLQKLPELLLEELKEYLRRKERISEKTSADITELENVRAIIRRLFENREKKLTELALYTARTGIPVENLTKQEEKTFFFLVDELRRYREMFFEELQKESGKDRMTNEVRQAALEEKVIAKEEIKEKLETMREEKSVPILQKRIVYRVKKSLSAFVGPDKKVYELIEGQVVELPEALNEFLLKEGVVEKIEE